jgi:hypothetical protein
MSIVSPHCLKMPKVVKKCLMMPAIAKKCEKMPISLYPDNSIRQVACFGIFTHKNACFDIFRHFYINKS